MIYQGGSLGDFVGVATGAEQQVSDLEGLMVSVSGTFVGTLNIEISFDGVSWVVLQSLTVPGLVPTAGGAPGVGIFPPCQAIRADCPAWTSGTIEVRWGARRPVASNLLTAIQS